MILLLNLVTYCLCIEGFKLQYKQSQPIINSNFDFKKDQKYNNDALMTRSLESRQRLAFKVRDQSEMDNFYSRPNQVANLMCNKIKSLWYWLFGGKKDVKNVTSTNPVVYVVSNLSSKNSPSVLDEVVEKRKSWHKYAEDKLREIDSYMTSKKIPFFSKFTNSTSVTTNSANSDKRDRSAEIAAVTSLVEEKKKRKSPVKRGTTNTSISDLTNINDNTNSTSIKKKRKGRSPKTSSTSGSSPILTSSDSNSTDIAPLAEDPSHSSSSPAVVNKKKRSSKKNQKAKSDKIIITNTPSTVNDVSNISVSTSM